MFVGISGVSITETTNLCESLEKECNLKFVHISDEQFKIGRDLPQDFQGKIMFFNELLKKLSLILKSHQNEVGIMLNKTPLDLAKDALISVDGKLNKAQQYELNNYIQRCLELCVEYFSEIIIVQPMNNGNVGYISRENTILLGLALDDMIVKNLSVRKITSDTVKQKAKANLVKRFLDDENQKAIKKAFVATSTFQ